MKKARPATLEKFFRQHGARDEEKIQQRLTDIRNAVPATFDRAVIESSQLMIGAWLPQLKALREAIRGLEKAIRELATAQPDWAIFDSLPGG